MHEKNQESLILALRNTSVFPHATDRWQLTNTQVEMAVLH